MFEVEYERDADGDAFLSRTVDVMAALQEAVKDGACKITHEIIDESRGLYRVELLDGDEWGQGRDLNTALRYALGAHFDTERIS